MKTMQAGRGVAEVAGWEGSFCLPERVLQKLWLRRDFTQCGHVCGGKEWSLVQPGRWNLQAGPDFLGGVWRISGEVRGGDIEVHLRARDWFRHGHHEDPAYDAVSLHVVLFPPAPTEAWPVNSKGVPVEAQLPLLPLLRCGLEELAMEDALAELSGRDYLGLAESWAGRSTRELAEVCEQHAGLRWDTKCQHAAARIGRFGWKEACHQGALEVLGLRSNRAAMATIGARWNLDAFIHAPPGVPEILGYRGASWQWRGVRPANRPDARLRQYLAWVASRPEWPEHLIDWGQSVDAACRGCNGGLAEASAVRRVAGLRGHLERFADRIVGGAVGGGRLLNLVADLALPFLASQGGEGGESALRTAWLALPAADAPAEAGKVLRAGRLLGAGAPLSNGWIQAVLGALLAQRQAGITP